jgi:D-cysteine desulfhydrase
MMDPAAGARRAPPLFDRYPALASTLGWTPLIETSSPISRLTHLEAAAGGQVMLLAKRDDRGAPGVRGTKLRKLEFFLGEARRTNRAAVLTFGAVDSNHVLATAICGAGLGFGVACVVTPAPAGPRVRRHLRMMLAAGTTLVSCRGPLRSAAGRRATAVAAAALARRFAGVPFVIPFVGGGVLGAVGGVNAAFELRDQVARGELPAPARIYVPLATMGMAAGLIVGLELAGLRSQLVGVRVVDEGNATAAALRGLVHRTNRFLHDRDPAIPLRTFDARDIVVTHESAGSGYRAATTATRRAAGLARNDQLPVDHIYTSKALAALLADAARGTDGPLLLWNTTAVAPPRVAGAPPAVPRAFKRYFTATSR